MKVYTLTRLTRKIDEQRRVVIQGFEVRARLVKVALIGAVPAGLLAAMSATVLGVYAIVVFAAVEAAVYILLEARIRSGLRLRAYQDLLDRSRSKVGMFQVAGETVDPLGGDWGYVSASSRPRKRHEPDDIDVAELAGGRAGVPATRRSTAAGR